MYVVTVGSGNSGGGAIHDYLYNREDFRSPFFGNEFRLVNDPDGIDSLYKNFYENFSVNNAASAFERFEKFSILSTKIKGHINNEWSRIYPENSEKIILNYLKRISHIEYYAMPQFKYLSLNIIKKLHFFIKYRLLKEKINKIKLFKVRLPKNEKKFLFETRKLLDELCQKKNKSKKSNIILDQSVSYWRPTDYLKYFHNLKIIIVNRDPRSIYYSMYLRNSKAYPSSNVTTFTEWYKKIRNSQLKIKNKNIYIIQYENFLNNFEIESKKLNNFLKINQKIKSKFDPEFSKKNVLKAKDKLNKKDKNYLEKKLKNYLVW